MVLSLLGGLLVLGVNLGQAKEQPLQPATPPTVAKGQVVTIDADEQVYDVRKNLTTFVGHVVVKTGEVVIEAPWGEVTLNAANEPQEAHFWDKVLITRAKDTLKAPEAFFNFTTKEFTAVGGVDSLMQRQGKGPIHLTSSSQQFSQLRRQLLATGAVKVTMEEGLATSQQMLLQLDGNDQVQRVNFLGQASLKQPKQWVRGHSITLEPPRKVFSAEGGVRTEIEDQGKPKPIVIRSSYQQLDQNRGYMLASGNVLIDYQDYDAAAPKATFFLKEKSKKNGGGTAVDTIVLGGGRASVVEADRKVVGNLITIHTNPKHFEAQGNVKTRFLSKRAGPSSPSPAATAPPASKNKVKQSPAALNLRLPNTTEEEEFNPQAFSAPNAHQRKHGRPS
jgi:lipopolysaccharide export system protein LptA